MSGNGSETSIVDELNQKIAELQKTMDDQVRGNYGSCDLRQVVDVLWIM